MNKIRLILDAGTLQRSLLTRGLLIRELAEAAGVSRQAAGRACRTGQCGMKVARALCSALGLQLGEVLMPEKRAWDN